MKHWPGRFSLISLLSDSDYKMQGDMQSFLQDFLSSYINRSFALLKFSAFSGRPFFKADIYSIFCI